MRRAFVLQLASQSQPRLRHFEGWIEEVDTGRDRHFRSTDELVAFLAECFERNAATEGRREGGADTES